VRAARSLRGIADPRDENLVMRTLRVCFPHHAGTLERLKESKVVVVPMKELPRPGTMLGFDDALGFLIYTAATGSKNVKAYIKFIENANLLRGSDGAAPCCSCSTTSRTWLLLSLNPTFGTESLRCSITP